MEKIKKETKQNLSLNCLDKINVLEKEMLYSESEFRNKQSIVVENFKRDLNNFITSVSSVFEIKTFENNKDLINISKASGLTYIPSNIIPSNEDPTNASQSSNNFLSKKTSRKSEVEGKEKPNIFNSNKTIKNKTKKKVFSIFKDKTRKKPYKKLGYKKKDIYVYRGSKYRGVTKNGKTWQVLIMINRNKKYYGNFKSEESAAKAYDELAMQYHKEKARLNFAHEGFLQYTNEN